MKKATRSVGTILNNPSSHLARLLASVHVLQELDQIIGATLPAPAADHCKAANIKGNQLVIIANSAAWATRLRYQGAQLIASLQEVPKFAHINDIHIKIRDLSHLQSVTKPTGGSL